MLKVTLTTLGCAALLASCAPMLTASTIGRAVNAGTGEEGTVTFQPGALRTQVGGPSGSNNATIVIGGQTYVGRTALLEGVVAASASTRLNLGIAFGSTTTNSNTTSGFGVFLGTAPTPRPTLRTGNLIARTAGDPPRTLTCTLQVDEREHGIGECTGSDGTRYVLQF